MTYLLQRGIPSCAHSAFECSIHNKWKECSSWRTD